MKRRSVIIVVVLVLGVAVVFALDWHFFLLTGRFTPKKIVETLKTPVAIVRVSDSGLLTTDGRIIPLPGISMVVVPASVAKDIVEHGAEVQSDGTVYALVRVHHWCGNDPVRFHLARLDLSSLLLVLAEQRQPRVTEFGVDPGIYGMATIPHQEIEELFHHKNSEPDGAANGSQPIRLETNTMSPAVPDR